MSIARNVIASKVTPRTYYEIREIPNSYYLEDIIGWLSVVVPLESTNIIRNPQLLDLNDNNNPDSWIDATVAGSYNFDPIGGPYSGGSMMATNFTGGEISYTQVGLTASETYVPSLVMRGNGRVRIEITDTFNVVSTATFDLNPEWSQYILPSYVATNQFVVLRIFPEGTVASFEVGFFQLETNSQNVATTPFDGSFSGYQFESSNVYHWNGVANLSSSTRLVDTVTGGQVINLLEEFGFCITEAEGFGIPEELEVISSAFALRQGSLVRCKTITERTLTIAGQLLKCSFKDLICSRNGIGKTIFSRNQLRKFLWQPIVNCVPLPCVEFIACLTGGLQGVYDNLYGENIEIDLTMFDPNFYSCYRHSEILETRNTESFSALVAITNSGEAVGPLDTGINQPLIQGQNFYNYCISPYDGNLYYTFLDTGFTRVLNRFDGTTHTEIATFTVSNNPDPNFDNELRLTCCGSKLYVGGSFGAANGAGGFIGASGNSIAEFNLVAQTVVNIGNITSGGLHGLVTHILCETTGLVANGIFDSAGGVATTNLSRYDGTTFITNNFPIGNSGSGGRVNDMIKWVEGSISPSIFVGSFQNNTNATFNNVDATLPEAIAYFDGSSIVRTDFIFDIADPGFQIAEMTSAIRFNDTVFVTGNFGDVTTDVAFWIGSLGNRHRGVAVLDLNLSQPSNGIVGRLLPLAGDMDASPPTGRGTDGSQPTTSQNGQTGLTEIARDMAIVNGELYVVGTLDVYGLIDSDGLVDPGQGIIDPKVTLCGGFIWTPDVSDARFGVARPLELDLSGFDLAGVACRIIAIESVPETAPPHLGYSHIYKIASNQATPSTFETGGVTEIVLCNDDFEDLTFRIHIEGPGDLRSITVDDVIVFNSEANPIRIEGDETFIADFEAIPATFTLSDGTTFSGESFRQSTISSPVSVINIRFTPSAIDNPTAFISYKPAHISSEVLLCEPCT